MSERNLDQLFQPGSVAVIGASDRSQSLGATLMLRLLDGGFVGPVWPVNPKHASVAGLPAYPDVTSLPQTPDLAVICTAAPAVPSLIDELVRKGTRAAVVFTVGLLVPGIGLNASFANTSALPGLLAFVSQSGALTTALRLVPLRQLR